MEAFLEETTTPCNNSKQKINIISDVPKTKPATAKNPGRVASGKRLAEHNRLAREAKKQAKTLKPPTNSTTDTSASATNNTTYRAIKQRKKQHKHSLPYSDGWQFDCLCFGCVLPM